MQLTVCQKSLSSITVATAEMCEPTHFRVPFRRYNREPLTPSRLPAEAGSVGGVTGSDSAAEIHDDGRTSPASVSAPSLCLKHSELWHTFSAVGTEMVITKSGRHVCGLRHKYLEIVVPAVSR